MRKSLVAVLLDGLRPPLRVATQRLRLWSLVLALVGVGGLALEGARVLRDLEPPRVLALRWSYHAPGGHRAHAEWSGPTRPGWMGQGGVPEGRGPSLSPPIPNQGGDVDVRVYTSLGFPREARGSSTRGDARGGRAAPELAKSSLLILSRLE